MTIASVLTTTFVSVLPCATCDYTIENSIIGLNVVLKFVYVQSIKFSMWPLGPVVSVTVISVIISITICFIYISLPRSVRPCRNVPHKLLATVSEYISSR